MSEIELPTYYVVVEDNDTMSRVESAKPGKSVQVRVRCEEAPADAPIVAKGIFLSLTCPVTEAKAALTHSPIAINRDSRIKR